MRQHIRGQAHPPQHEEHAERRRRHRQGKTPHQRAAQETEFHERRQQRIVQRRAPQAAR